MRVFQWGVPGEYRLDLVQAPTSRHRRPRGRHGAREAAVQPGPSAHAGRRPSYTARRSAPLPRGMPLRQQNGVRNAAPGQVRIRRIDQVHHAAGLTRPRPAGRPAGGVESRALGLRDYGVITHASSEKRRVKCRLPARQQLRPSRRVLTRLRRTRCETCLPQHTHDCL